MTKKELVKMLDNELEDDDIIDYLSITDRDNNELDFNSTSRGAFIQGYYKMPNYKHHNDPSNNL